MILIPIRLGLLIINADRYYVAYNACKHCQIPRRKTLSSLLSTTVKQYPPPEAQIYHAQQRIRERYCHWEWYQQPGELRGDHREMCLLFLTMTDVDDRAITTAPGLVAVAIAPLDTTTPTRECTTSFGMQRFKDFC